MRKSKVLNFPGRAAGGLDLQAPMRTLIHSLNHARETPPAIVAFIAARRGEGVSTLARGYAETISGEMNRKTLLIEAGPSSLPVALGLADAVIVGHDRQHVILRVTEKLFCCRWSKDESHKAAAERLQDAPFWKNLAAEFDAVIIDAPSLHYSHEGILLAARADATIIVTQAETTPEFAVAHLRDRLSKAGAKIAGLVLNKRRYHIPDNVYGQC